MRRHVIRALVFAIVAFACFRAFRKYQVDTRYAAAPESLRRCLNALPEDMVGYAVTPWVGASGHQAASWGARYVGLCDEMVETEGDWLLTAFGPYVLEKPGITVGAFFGAELWLGFGPGGSGKRACLDHVGFGPPTGMDGAMYVWDDEPPIWLELGAPVKLRTAVKALDVTDTEGRTARVSIPH